MEISRFARAAVVLLVPVLVLGACDAGSEPAGPEDDDPSMQPTLRERFDLQPVPPVPFPSDNPRMEERIELGRLMFFDPILGGEKDVSCGTCHHPDFAFADGRALGAGVSGEGLGPDRELGRSTIAPHPEIEDEPRNSQTILNAALNGAGGTTPSADGFQFWDGRTRGLEEQATKPITSRAEMRGLAYDEPESQDSVVARLASIAEYRHLFEEAFPDVAADVRAGRRDSLITLDTYSRALAAYERELVAVNSPYDRWLAGDEDAMTEEQKRGLELFFTKAKCGECHGGPMFSNFQFIVNGVPQTGPGKDDVLADDDAGREEFTRMDRDRYAFRTPTVRNVELTGPYMHSGAFETLEEVVQFYNAGAHPRHEDITDVMLHPVLRDPLGLSLEEVKAVVAFMKALTDPGTEIPERLKTVPESVPSGLAPVFGIRAPND